MAVRSCIGFVLASLVAAASARDAAAQSANAVAPSALVAAAKSAKLSEVDADYARCHGDRAIEAWLADVVGDTGRIEWQGGRCNLVDSVDALSEACGGAAVEPNGHPDEPAYLEVYFEKPNGGKAGKPYTVRGVNYDVDGVDFKRSLAEFENGYRRKYRKGGDASPHACD
ncbi:MAG TPA: hypothetical protein VJ696_03035 [Rhodanobacteraceae bacterium]|nr:hypothetical protein [Rhodanobacteraceae bacterium]